MKNYQLNSYLQLNGFTDQSICMKEAVGLSKCFAAYAEFTPNEEIIEIGFNPNSGYVYISLEHYSISICSMVGCDVEYLVTDFEDGEEYFFDSYEDAVEKQLSINS